MQTQTVFAGHTEGMSSDVAPPSRRGRLVLAALLPLAGLVTPNVDEAADLLDAEPAADVDDLFEQAREIIALGAQRVLV